MAADNLDRLLRAQHRDAVLSQEHEYLSDHTAVEVFEIGQTSASTQHMNDAALQAYLTNNETLLSEEVKFRAIFVPDDVQESGKLQLSRPAFELLLDRLGICSRFSGMIHMQMRPSRRIKYDTMGNILQIEYTYSAVLRNSRAANSPNDDSKRILDWQRLVVWTRHDLVNSNRTMVLLRCPDIILKKFIALFGDRGEGQQSLLRYSMLPHAFIAEHLVKRCFEYSKSWAAPMFLLETSTGHAAIEYTQRAQRFMIMARQIGNILIDYDIYSASLELLQEIHSLVKNSPPPAGVTEYDWQCIHREFDDEIFRQVRQEYALLKHYGELYERRSMIGNQECTALINQREIEITKSMSAESTIIARSAHRDGLSLQVIQYLGLVFLPLSLCASIFGMSFFSTSPNRKAPDHASFNVADQWWWFVVVSASFTVIVLTSALLSVRWFTNRDDERRKSDLTDLETVFSNNA